MSQRLPRTELEAIVDQLYALSRLVYELALDFDVKLRLRDPA